MTERLTEQPTDSSTTLPPVVVTVEVGVPPETAFRAFTSDFDRWWPRAHHIGAADLAEAVIEPRAGGRFYERGVDGSECDWGEVLEWDPPHRLVLAWGLDGTWTFHPGVENASRVEVAFTPLGRDRARVELTHSEFERHGATGTAARTGVGGDGGWSGLLAVYARRVEAA